jgi:hypothetical protein
LFINGQLGDPGGVRHQFNRGFGPCLSPFRWRSRAILS